MSDRYVERLGFLFELAKEVPGIRRNRTGGYYFAAAIFHRNRIVSIGYNHRKSSPLQKRFGKNDDSIYYHAEIHAIRNALRNVDHDDLRRCVMYIARARWKSQYERVRVWGMAKPCSGCLMALDAFRIKAAIYTVDEGRYGILDLSFGSETLVYV